MKNDFHKRLSQFLVPALMGQARMVTTLAVYGVIAVLLLTYVTAQVYTSMLTQEIAVLKIERSQQREHLNVLTSDYVSQTSRVRVAKYCADKLGMVTAHDNSFERFAVSEKVWQFSEPMEIAERYSPIPAAARFTLLRNE